MSDEIYTPEGLPEGMAGDSNTGTIDNLIAGFGELNQPYQPEGLPEQYHGKGNNEIIDGLLGENTGYRKAQSQIEHAPEDVTGYKFEPGEGIKQYFPEMEEGAVDPRLEIASNAALEVAMPPSMFNNFMNSVYGKISENEAFPRPDQDVVVMDKVDQAAEYAAFGKGENLGDDAEISKRVDELTSFGNAYVEQAKLGEGAAVEIEVLSQTSGGLALLAKIQNDLRERGITPGGETEENAGMDDDTFAKLGGSEAVDPQSSQYDAAKAKAYEAEIARRHRAKQQKTGVV